MGGAGWFSDWLMVCPLELVLYGWDWLVFRLVNGLPPRADTLWVGWLVFKLVNGLPPRASTLWVGLAGFQTG